MPQSNNESYFASLTQEKQDWHRSSKFVGVIYASRDYNEERLPNGQVIHTDYSNFRSEHNGED